MRVIRFLIEATRSYRLYVLGMILAVTMVTLANTVRPNVIKEFIDIVASKDQ